MPVLHAVVLQRAGALVHRPHDAQEGVVGRTHGGQQHIPRFQRPEQGAGNGVGAVDKLDAHQGGLGAEEAGINFI